MLTASFRRKTVLLVLFVVLVAPWASATEVRSEGRQAVQAIEASPLDLLGRAWSFLRNVWAKSACSIDPDGLCPAQPPIQAKSACNIDPNGLCRP
jgi:hypothetical protein